MPDHDLIGGPLDSAEAGRRLGRYLSEVVRDAVEQLPSDRRADAGASLVNELARRLGGRELAIPPEVLEAIVEKGQPVPIRPMTPLGDTVLFTNAPDEPSVASEIGREMASADRVDAIVAFVRWSGIRLLEEQLRAFLAAGNVVRLITTTYTGATERTALDRLVRMGVEIKVTYDKRSTRLHAKAWFFHRRTGADTAWIGSSNLSRAALVDGLEWNVRASRLTTPDLIDKFETSFESYWADPHFERYDPDRDGERFDKAVESKPETAIDFSFIDITPYPFQQQMLDRLDAERVRHDRWRNLVVAATGTGKTIVSALDYRRLARSLDQSKLLFVAHRKEILQQSLATFRAVMRDGSFGELYVDGHRPDEWTHVFASIQSLKKDTIERLDPHAFDVVIVDEFHHAAAPTYRALLEHVRPRVLLGLTATPERTDGQSILEWFDGRIAVELRLWDALDQQLLVPFHYFGVHDGVSLKAMTWSHGGYDLGELENVYTGNDARVAKVLQAIEDKIGNRSTMRALGFCVSIDHAEYMARKFNEAGVPSRAVSANSSKEERGAALRLLQLGEINAVFAVDLFNEGVDVPDIDTVLFLRPTESATVFLQQLGRGLRKSSDKPVLTVLDFVGHQNASFRFDLRYRAMVGGTRRELITAIEDGFPFLPSGCHVELDRVASQLVLENVKSALPGRWKSRVDELRGLGNVSLARYLSETGLELEDIYQGNRSWTDHQMAAELRPELVGPDEKRFGRAIGRMLHTDDPERLNFLRGLLASGRSPSQFPTERERRLAWMFHLSLWGTQTPQPSLQVGLDAFLRSPLRAELHEVVGLLDDRAETIHRPLDIADVPLMIHGTYSRDEVLGAFGLGSPSKPPQVREGVKWVEEANTDLFFVTLQKSDNDYSPTTRYRDFAISPELFHWESQSTTTEDGPVGRRYRQHREDGSHVLMFVREHRRTSRGTTEPYLFLGPMSYVSHTGERPMALTWRLHHRIPGEMYGRAKAVAG